GRCQWPEEPDGIHPTPAGTHPRGPAALARPPLANSWDHGPAVDARRAWPPQRTTRRSLQRQPCQQAAGAALRPADTVIRPRRARRLAAGFRTEWQWEQRILPYWHEMAAFAAERKKNLACLQHPDS